MSTRSTPKQRELLLLLQASSRPLPKAELDGRVVRAVLARGWALEIKRTLVLTAAGGEAIQQSDHEGSGRRKRRTAVNARAEVIHKAVKKLATAVPPDSELAVGPMFAHIDDVLDGFRKVAERIDSGK